MSEDLSHFFQEVKSAFAARLSNPLIGTFTVSWIVVNHRLFFALFSDKPVSWRFEYIDSVMYGNWLTVLGKGLVIPLLVTLAYLYLLPRVAKPVYRRVLEDQQEMNNIKRKTDGERLISEEDRRQVLLQANQLKEEASVALRKAEVAEGQAALRVEEIELAAANKEREAKDRIDRARKEVAVIEKDFSLVSDKLILEKACNAKSHDAAEAADRMSIYLRSRDFYISFQSSKGLIQEDLRFEADGVVVPVDGDNSAVTRWAFIDAQLELSLKYGGPPLQLRMNTGSGNFEGFYQRSPAFLNRTKAKQK